LHQSKQYVECDTEDNLLEVVALVEARRGNITRDEAEAIVLGADPEDAEEPATPTFRAWWHEWLPTKTRISPGTRATYKQQLNRLCSMLADEKGGPFGDRCLADISGLDIGRLINALRANGLGNKTITRYYSVMFSAFNAAVLQGLIAKNPCRDSDFERDQVADDDTGEEDHVYLTSEEFWLLHDCLAPDSQNFAEVSVATGARFSETSALTPMDLVRPTARHPLPRLWIRRAWKRGEDGTWYLGTTKGRQKRLITIDQALFELLQRCSKAKEPDDLLFAAPAGGRLIHENFMAKRWNPAVVLAMRCAAHPPAPQERPLEDAAGTCGEHGGRRTDGKPCQAALKPGVDRCRWHCGPEREAVSTCECLGVLHQRPTPHDLRHTCVAWLFADPTVTVIAVSRFVGHATMAVTDTVYGGLMPSTEAAAASALGRARGRNSVALAA
jgi:integrase